MKSKFSVAVREKARMTWLQTKTAETHETFNDASKETRRLVNRKKRSCLKLKVEEIETNGQANNTRAVFAGINQHKKGFQARVNAIRDEAGELVAYERG